jgi:uncharacterized YigZ family protein
MTDLSDNYLVVRTDAEAAIKVKGSRFICRVRLVETLDEVEESLASIRKQEYAATHNCFAWQIGIGSQMQFKYSDDGEPSGSAGRPIYDCIVGRKIHNCLVVVTRYFGGTKLGTGGLVRAYSDAAIDALDAAGVQRYFVKEQLKLRIEFGMYDSLQKLISRLGADVVDSDFADKVTLTLSIRKSRSDELYNEIVELTSGRAEIER